MDKGTDSLRLKVARLSRNLEVAKAKLLLLYTIRMQYRCRSILAHIYRYFGTNYCGLTAKEATDSLCQKLCTQAWKHCNAPATHKKTRSDVHLITTEAQHAELKLAWAWPEEEDV